MVSGSEAVGVALFITMPRVDDDESHGRYLAQHDVLVLLCSIRQLFFSVMLADVLANLAIYGFIMPIALYRTLDPKSTLFMRLATPPKQSLIPLFVLYVVGVTCRSIGLIEHAFFNRERAW